MQPVLVPKTLDARSRLLFWESDYVIVALGGLWPVCLCRDSPQD